MTDAVLQELLPAMKAQFHDLTGRVIPVETAVSELFLPLSLQEAILRCVQKLGLHGRILDAPEQAPQPAVCVLLPGLKLSPCLLLLSLEEVSSDRVRVTACAAAGVLPLPGFAQKQADGILLQLIH